MKKKKRPLVPEKVRKKLIAKFRKSTWPKRSEKTTFKELEAAVKDYTFFLREETEQGALFKLLRPVDVRFYPWDKEDIRSGDDLIRPLAGRHVKTYKVVCVKYEKDESKRRFYHKDLGQEPELIFQHKIGEALAGEKTVDDFLGGLKRVPSRFRGSIRTSLKRLKKDKEHFHAYEIELKVAELDTPEHDLLKIQKKEELSRRLTNRERQVMDLSEKGHKKADIARHLGISRVRVGQIVEEIERIEKDIDKKNETKLKNFF